MIGSGMVFRRFVYRPDRVTRKYACVWLALAGLVGTMTAFAQDVAISVQMSVPLSAASSRKGDMIAGQVTSPDSLKGDTLQGMVSQVNSRGQASVTFTFNTLRHGGLSIPVTATLQAVSNSKGVPGADEHGNALRANNTAGARPVSASKIGGQLGGLLGGRTGQAVSDAGSDVNTSGGAGAMQLAAAGSSLELAPGAMLMISAKTNGNGPALENLAPAAPIAAMAPMANPRPVAAPPQMATASPAPSGDIGGQPDLKSTKIEFLPGERTIFFEDFSDMAEDEPPPHWKVREGTVELRTGGGIRELYAEKNVHLTSASFDAPVNFTFEADWTGGGQMVWEFLDGKGGTSLSALVRGEPNGHTASLTVNGSDGKLGDGGIETDTSKPVRFSIWAQQGRVRAYLNGQRIVDANQVKFDPVNQLRLDFAGYRPNGLRLVRVAESAPDFSTLIGSAGKYVTHGITFEADSDRLRPESAAVLKQVAAALARNPNLRLEIDGYSDSLGRAERNLELSKHRAQAVQQVLVTQFGVDADRLSSNGFGADNPVGSNDTPDGRAANRRVEFLKK